MKLSLLTLLLSSIAVVSSLKTTCQSYTTRTIPSFSVAPATPINYPPLHVSPCTLLNFGIIPHTAEEDFNILRITNKDIDTFNKCENLVNNDDSIFSEYWNIVQPTPGVNLSPTVFRIQNDYTTESSLYFTSNKPSLCKQGLKIHIIVTPVSNRFDDSTENLWSTIYGSSQIDTPVSTKLDYESGSLYKLVNTRGNYQVPLPIHVPALVDEMKTEEENRLKLILNMGFSDIILERIDIISSTVIWVKSFSSVGNELGKAMTLGDDGVIFITGISDGVMFDKSQGNVPFLIKLDSLTGEIIEEVSLESPDDVRVPVDILVMEPSFDVLLLMKNGHTIELLRLKSSGFGSFSMAGTVQEWGTQCNDASPSPCTYYSSYETVERAAHDLIPTSMALSPYDLSSSIVIEEPDFLYISGYTSGTLDNGNGEARSGNIDGFIMKLSISGDTADSSVRIKTQGTTVVNAICMDDNDGGAIVIGTTNDGGAGDDAYYMKYSFDLQKEEWRKVINSIGNGRECGISCNSHIPSHVEDTNRGVILVGTSNSVGEDNNIPNYGGVIFSKSVTDSNYVEDGKRLGSVDIWITSINSLTGDIIWGEQFGGSEEDSVFSESIAVDNLGEIYLIGYTRSSEDFFRYDEEEYIRGAYGSEDVYVVKISGHSGSLPASYYPIRRSKTEDEGLGAVGVIGIVVGCVVLLGAGLVAGVYVGIKRTEAKYKTLEEAGTEAGMEAGTELVDKSGRLGMVLGGDEDEEL